LSRAATERTQYVASAEKEENVYPWGDAPPDAPDAAGDWRANFDTLDGDTDKDGYKGTAPVKSFEKFSSPFGVVNMAGNVWEWTQKRILKGGGYLSLDVEDLRINEVRHAGPNEKEGFRCVKVDK
jgi:formylglycine-generating enzyme required for sulfatase activity